jgi:hypothetical protein
MIELLVLAHLLAQSVHFCMANKNTPAGFEKFCHFCVGNLRVCVFPILLKNDQKMA